MAWQCDAMASVSLSVPEVTALLGSSAAGWPGLGLIVTLGTPADPASTREVTVHHDGRVVGFTEPSRQFPAKRVYRVVIAADHPGVGLPAGVLPPDPLQALRNAQLRWLPEGHPDRPAVGSVRRNSYS